MQPDQSGNSCHHHWTYPNDADFYIDLLFYHVKLHCYVVVELKTGAFKPAVLGQVRAGACL